MSERMIPANIFIEFVDIPWNFEEDLKKETEQNGGDSSSLGMEPEKYDFDPGVIFPVFNGGSYQILAGFLRIGDLIAGSNLQTET